MLIILTGPSGSGKSSFCKHFRHYDIYLSSDLYRDVIGESESDQTVSAIVFDVLEWNVRYFLKQNDWVLLDATNLDKRSRGRFVKAARYLGKKVCVYYFDVPIEVCKERNGKRERVVPVSVIEKQFIKLEKPTKDEVDYLYVVDRDGVTKEEF